jgi:hypothetical protein
LNFEKREERSLFRANMALRLLEKIARLDRGVGAVQVNIGCQIGAINIRK